MKIQNEHLLLYNLSYLARTTDGQFPGKYSQTVSGIS